MPYGEIFAQVYNEYFTGFATAVAPRIRDYFESKPIATKNKSVLDLCCGTGQLALHFLQKGYYVVGIDSSKHMLSIARQNASEYLSCGLVKFVEGDVTEFTLNGTFGLAVSTYNSLNHLATLGDLRRCFMNVFSLLEKNGLFVFDLSTFASIPLWSGITASDGENATLLTRGVFDEKNNRILTRTSGFARLRDGRIYRVDDTASLTLFKLQSVEELLFEVGWAEVQFTDLVNLYSPLSNPEDYPEVFVIATK